MTSIKVIEDDSSITTPMQRTEERDWLSRQVYGLPLTGNVRSLSQ
ncbi:MAG: hypothetical protein AAGI69_10275 [Cyanobacteria bacterium P01_H01_bin.21]